MSALQETLLCPLNAFSKFILKDAFRNVYLVSITCHCCKSNLIFRGSMRSPCHIFIATFD